MKYLIRFNESIDEIEKFSRDSLAYLLDEGFEFKKISSDRVLVLYQNYSD
jgi:hypothetical protein